MGSYVFWISGFILALIAIYLWLTATGTQKYGAVFNREQTSGQIDAFSKGGSFIRFRYFSSKFVEIAHVYRMDELLFMEIICESDSEEFAILAEVVATIPDVRVEDSKIFSLRPDNLRRIVLGLFDELKRRNMFLRVAVL